MNDKLDLSPFHFNAGTLMLPSSWQDASILVLNSPDEKNGTSFTISRDDLPWGLAFSQFAEREMTTISKQLKDYTAIAHESGELNGFETETFEFRWRAPNGAVHQLMMMLNTPTQVLIFTGTCQGDMTPAQREQMQTMMATFQLRGEQKDNA
ncbi:DcrB-related protein [Xenorhabdus taiwanensis]|uniref:DcrB-related protein n=1 Tax=Xenorhabdus taiwanensis TaxID=3085177 RepID=A0ABM8JRE8_9GAMM|nr:DcrB-related protein [Xenorhabdus sp. TCT-1]